jgi:EpsI family protein
MTSLKRVLICSFVLLVALAAQAGLEAMTTIERPRLLAPLASIPMELGNWVGADATIDPSILKESQADDYLNRVYEDRTQPGRRLWLWINYSRTGLNLRHSPEICLPSGGWSKVESQCSVIPVAAHQAAEETFPVTRLAYSQGELVQIVGFWYYIFGESQLEQYVRSLPITSRSSHGRTTRGSGMTVEVFCPGTTDPDGEGLRDFASRLLPAIEPIIPTENRANYHIP